MKKLLHALPLTILLALAACGKGLDSRVIEGHWVAENFRFYGLKLPIGPDLQIDAKSLRLSTDLEPIPLTAVEVDGNEVTLQTSLGVGLVFNFENENRMYFSMPILGDRIYYQRQLTPAVAQSDVQQRSSTKHRLNQADAPPQTPRALNHTEPTSLPLTASHPPSSGLTPHPTKFTNFTRALDLVQQGRTDEAIRALSSALENTETQWKDIEAEPAFALLIQDPRLEVLKLRWQSKP